MTSGNSDIAQAPVLSIPATTHQLSPHQGDEFIDVTIVLRRRDGAPTATTWPDPPAATHQNFATLCGAHPASIQRLRKFADAHDLQETDYQPYRRVLHLRGTAANLQRAFDVQLSRYQPLDGSPMVLGCSGAPRLPDDAIAVLGLDRRPVARPHVRKPRTQPSHTYTPIQLGGVYAFPAGADGSGQTVAVIELGGGYQE